MAKAGGTGHGQRSKLNVFVRLFVCFLHILKAYHALRCHGIICPYLSVSARCFYTTLTENEVLPVLVDFN